MSAFLFAAWLAGQSADLGTTVWKLRQPGFTEGNRLYPRSAAGVAGMKLGITAGVAIWTWQHRRSHPRMTRIVWITGAVAGSWATWHNTRLRPASRAAAGHR